jgi:hypothetical protein
VPLGKIFAAPSRGVLLNFSEHLSRGDLIFKKKYDLGIEPGSVLFDTSSTSIQSIDGLACDNWPIIIPDRVMIGLPPVRGTAFGTRCDATSHMAVASSNSRWSL